MRAGPDDAIHLVRGRAASPVAMFHLYAVQGPNGGYDGIFGRGGFGVDLVVVISGLIIHATSSKRPGLAAARFPRARFWRIAPPYRAALVCCISVLAAFRIASGEGSRVPDLYELMVLLGALGDHIIVPAWRLALEMIFCPVFEALGLWIAVT